MDLNSRNGFYISKGFISGFSLPVNTAPHLNAALLASAEKLMNSKRVALSQHLPLAV